MNRARVFLVVVFIAALILCVLAILASLMTLYYIGAVIAIITGCLALTGTWLNQLLKEEDQ